MSMLKQFIDDYEQHMVKAEAYLANLHTFLCKKEAYVPEGPLMDRYYALSTGVTAMLDYLQNIEVTTEDDRAKAEMVLLHLISLIKTNPY